MHHLYDYLKIMMMSLNIIILLMTILSSQLKFLTTLKVKLEKFIRTIPGSIIHYLYIDVEKWDFFIVFLI